MSAAEVAVTPDRVATIAILVWFFLGPTRDREAKVRAKEREIEITIKGVCPPDVSYQSEGVHQGLSASWPTASFQSQTQSWRRDMDERGMRSTATQIPMGEDVQRVGADVCSLEWLLGLRTCWELLNPTKNILEIFVH